jgi:hypothetical protein
VDENVVLVSQDDNGSDGEGNNDMGSDDSEANDSDDDKDKAMHIPFRMTPSRIQSYKCPICLVEEYDSEVKVVFHALEVIKQDVVERHRMVLLVDDNDLISLFIVI